MRAVSTAEQVFRPPAARPAKPPELPPSEFSRYRDGFRAMKTTNPVSSVGSSSV